MTRKELARIFEITEHYVNSLTKAGMPQVKRGRYEVGPCMVWYLRHLKEILRQRRYLDDAELAKMERAERLRLVQAEAGLKELELARERGEFAAVADFEKMVTEMVVTTKARILALPARISAQLVGEQQSAIEDLLEHELREALSTLTNGFEKDARADGSKRNFGGEGKNGSSGSAGKSETSIAAAREIRV
jgi:phage terminase Nu1 subunit (DNA packaging protein)